MDIVFSSYMRMHRKHSLAVRNADLLIPIQIACFSNVIVYILNGDNFKYTLFAHMQTICIYRTPYSQNVSKCVLKLEIDFDVCFIISTLDIMFVIYTLGWKWISQFHSQSAPMA